jgi:hypothetical protein
MPRGADREYLTILGIVAIYVASLPTGATIVSVTRDLHRSLQHVRRCCCGAEINFALWVKDRSAADAIVREVRSPPSGRSDRAGQDARRSAAHSSP